VVLRHELAHSNAVHTCHTPDCMNLVPVVLTWHSTLCNRHPLKHMQASITSDYVGRVRQGNGLNIHLLQLPLKLTLSARHLHGRAAIYSRQPLNVRPLNPSFNTF
jgi:hypothetical protein